MKRTKGSNCIEFNAIASQASAQNMQWTRPSQARPVRPGQPGQVNMLQTDRNRQAGKHVTINIKDK